MAMSMKPFTPSYNSIATSFTMKAALFHSTPFLDRRKRTSWDTGGGPSKASKKSYNYSRRFRKMHSKHTLLRNVSEFAEHLFQSWQVDDGFSDPSSSRGSSWFRGEDWGKGRKKTYNGSQGDQWGSYRNRGGFHFCHGEDDDVEFIFRNAFGGERSTYWSFINEEEDDSSEWRSSGYTNNRRNSWKWKTRYEDDSDASEEDNVRSESDLASDRRALGLSASGPLKIGDVKSAYRACALKWHPDRHQGSSKAVAEEKFKLCSAAYQSLCDKLATAT